MIITLTFEIYGVRAFWSYCTVTFFQSIALWCQKYAFKHHWVTSCIYMHGADRMSCIVLTAIQRNLLIHWCSAAASVLLWLMLFHVLLLLHTILQNQFTITNTVWRRLKTKALSPNISRLNNTQAFTYRIYIYTYRRGLLECEICTFDLWLLGKLNIFLMFTHLWHFINQTMSWLIVFSSCESATLKYPFLFGPKWSKCNINVNISLILSSGWS